MVMITFKDKLVKIARDNQRNNCFFFQEKKCILHYYVCLFCTSYVKKIQGIDSTKDYLLLIGNRKTATRALFFSILSLIISILILFKDIFITYVQRKIQ